MGLSEKILDLDFPGFGGTLGEAITRASEGDVVAREALAASDVVLSDRGVLFILNINPYIGNREVIEAIANTRAKPA